MGMADALAFEAWQGLSIDERSRLLQDAKKHKRASQWKKARLAMMSGPYGLALLGLKTGYNGKYGQVNKAETKPLPKKEVIHLKSKQKKYTEAGAVLGLTSAGLVISGVGAKNLHRVGSLKNSAKVAALKANSGKIINTGYGVGTVGAGVSGFGNLNNARIQRNELERMQRSKVAKAYDPEKSREKRQKAYTVGLGAAGGGVIATPTKHLGERVGTGIYNERKAGHKTRVKIARQENKANKEARDVYTTEANRRYKTVTTPGKPTGKGKNKKPGAPIKTRVPYFKDAEEKIAAQNKANSASIKVTESTKKLKSLKTKAPQLSRYKTGGKIGQLTAGAALLGLAAGNEHHRRNGGKSYAGYGGGYTN